MTKKSETETQVNYTVLARKYRPTSFDGLIGQGGTVRILTNAVETGRLAHAFVLTGVRGVGKTTMARIIARVLNCIGEDGISGPTIKPCGVCEHCIAIGQDRHVDVLEMDAASRTGVDDIRELIEGVRYRPTSARYKVYIIDEVHMLSKNAFNALLKTLEEPPEHVKFIFATTEIRKIPVTVLSRCQRFDLRRVDEETLSNHFMMVAESEGAKISKSAVRLIARAADGSVRDGLSLLDQAIADRSTLVDDSEISNMLGLVDRSQTFSLIELVLKGDIVSALASFDQLYQDGADPSVVISDLLEITHWLTRIKIVPRVGDDYGVSEIERVNGKAMAERLTMASIARAWQMLLKGLSEVQNAPSPKQAAEMVLVRLAYTSDLPTPCDALKAFHADGTAPSGSDKVETKVPVASESSGLTQPNTLSSSSQLEQPQIALASGEANHASRPEMETKPNLSPTAKATTPKTFLEVAELAGEKGEVILRANIINNVHLVNFKPGRIEIGLGQHANKDLPHRIAKFLNESTSTRWVVTVSNQVGEPPLQQQWDKGNAEKRLGATRHPLVKAVLESFPGATVEAVRDPEVD